MRTAIRRATVVLAGVGLAVSAVAQTASADPSGATVTTAGATTGPGGALVPDNVRTAVGKGATRVPVSYADAALDASLEAAAKGAHTPAARQRVADLSKAGYASVKSSALAAVGGVNVVKDYANLPVQLVEVASPAALTALAARPGVASVNLDAMNTVDAADQDIIQQPAAVAKGWTGDGYRLAVIDTGVDYLTAPDPAIFGDCSAGPGTGTCRVASYTDWTGTGQRDIDPGKHGTNVSAIVLTTAPSARVDVYNVFQSTGGGIGAADSSVLGALNDVAGKAAAAKIRAVNMSLGDPRTYYTSMCSGSAYSAAFLNLRRLGVVPVVAAGNAAYIAGTFHDGVGSPACATGALVVGATYPAAQGGVGNADCGDPAPVADQITCFSQTGPLLDILAPGANITAAGITMYGTSQAAPHVTGAVGDLASAKPTATAGAIEHALVSQGPILTDPRDGTTARRLSINAAGIGLQAATTNVTPPISGSDRYGTSAAISLAAFPTPGVPVAYVASGVNFPDALSAGPLAGVKGGPLLLTAPGSIPAAIAAELTRVKPVSIVVVGGTGAVSDTVKAKLAAYATSGSVTRLSGSDRFGTSAAISNNGAFAPGVPVVYVASGMSFPDALAGGALAGIRKGPLLVTTPSKLPSAISAEVSRLNPGKVVILGGTAAVSATVQSQLGALVGSAKVTRIAGANRFATAAAASASYFRPGLATAYVASGANFPDALSAAPAAILGKGPILLTSPTSLPAPTRDEIVRLASGQVVILGGTGAVSAGVRSTIAALL